MQSGTGVADLRAGDERRTLAESRGRGGSAGALRDVLIDLAVFVRAGAEPFYRGDNHPRISLMDVVPGEPHAIECAGGKVFDQHVAAPDQTFQDLLALGVFGID